ncbi:amidase [Phenylobacterium soli]|uniref:Amidase n=1 Tax=Phenylobacterium soli TaxID=2170551 RepID=A0A328AEE0_9CAUL|nr:amidase [Phenylobacterium soli]RAK51128.1 amidase [Phenylobacterium soli]
MSKITRRGLAAAPVALVAVANAAAAKPRPASPQPAWPDATETAARIRRGELTAAEAVEAAIQRAERLQPALNFLVNSDFDRALAKAKTGAPQGAFAGVPFLVKDLNDYRGLPTRNGTRAALHSPPAASQADYISAFDRAGLVTIGKSATPEFGFLPTTEPLAFGPTRNPWDPQRSSGGSSGGAAAAVAAGIVPIAHASDGGGSIRIPASNCGLFGLKPSRGRMIGTRGETKITDLGVEHALSRSVRDSAALFALTEDAQPGAQLPPVGLVAGPAKRRLRVGLLMENGLGHAPSPEVVAATDAAAKMVASLGHRVEITQWPEDGARFIDDFLLVWAAGAAEIAAGIGKAMGKAPDETVLEPFTLGMVEMFRKAPPEALPAAMQRLEADALAYDTWFPAHQFDVVLSPVLSTPAPLLGEVGPSVPFDTLVARLKEYVGYTPLHNIAGAPAMSVPLYWTAAGLPVGAMFSARRGQERTLFELAYELEAARPWAQRAPAVRA